MARSVVATAPSAAPFWWALVVSTVALLLPLDGQLVDSASLFETWLGLPSDKLVHLLLFGGLALLAGRAQPREPSTTRNSRLVVAAVGLVAYAIAIEACQHVLPWRTFELLDLWADGLGVVLGTLLTLVLPVRRRGTSPSEP